MVRVICYGASGHGKVVADAVSAAGAMCVIGFIDDDAQRHGGRLAGLPILGGIDVLRGAEVSDALVIITVGRNDTRLRIADSLRAIGVRWGTAVHPRACVAAGVRLGAGAVVMAGAIINAGASVGEHAIVNTGATIDHDCVLEDGVHVSPGANLAGAVHVGRLCHIGTGAILLPGVRVGEGSTVGAGAVVLKDVRAGSTVVGNPARVLTS